MLLELRIRDYAIVDRLEVDFSGGLEVMTGETGAGKSIIVGALGLALGERAYAEQRRSGSSSTIVEARFSSHSAPQLKEKLEAADIEENDELILRRVVPASGKSRAYINDTAVSLATMNGIGRELVDIHGQHQHQSLLHPETHLDFLDGFGRLWDERTAWDETFRGWQALRREESELMRREGEKEQRLDYLRFREEEIARASLDPGEEEQLLAEREVLRHSERLAAVARDVEALVYSGEHPAAAAIDQAARRIGEVTSIDPSLEGVGRMLSESQLVLEEAGREIQEYRTRLASDPLRLEEVEGRLAEIAGLKKKYGSTVEGILEELERIGDEIAGLLSGTERLEAVRKELSTAAEELARRGKSLFRKRQACRRKLEEKVVSELASLHLPGGRFEVRLVREEDPEGPVVVDGKRYRADERGLERAEFFLSANAGEETKPLARIASGGELSRVMLAIKAVLNEVDRIPTLIFDEVDAGIGGKAAAVVGNRLKKIADGRQVICITHLPQIASLADGHYNISKSSRSGRTTVSVARLAGTERVEEVARMLGGRSITDASRRHAREMLREGG